MHLRDATKDDVPQIAAIYNAAVPMRIATADTEAVSMEAARIDFERRDPRTRPTVVAEDKREGRVTGYLAFHDFYGRPAYRHTAEVSVYVHPSFRHRGVGRTLLEAGMERAPSLDLHTLLAYIFADNEPSLKLFERFGFGQWGRLPRVAEMDGQERDLLILGRRLDE